MCGLTSKQVLAWYVATLNESQMQMDAGKSQDDTGSGGEESGPVTLEQFREEFRSQHPGKSDEWWIERHAEFEANRVSGGN